MATWKKLGQIFNPLDFPGRPEWLFEFAIAPCTYIFDDVVRVYFGCRPPRDENGMRVTYTAFIDLDRKNLFSIRDIASKPVLQLGGVGAFDQFGTYPLSVIHKEGDASGQLFGVYAGWTRCESVPFNVSIGAAVSIDNGLSFNKIGSGPLIPYSHNEPFVLSGPKIRKFEDIYYLFYIAGRDWIEVDGRFEISHKIRMAKSYDFISWTKHEHDLIPNAWDEYESQSSPDVIYANGKYHMFFCGWIPSSFRKTKSRKIGYAWSTDLINWHRDDTLAGITNSQIGWDSEMIAYPHVFELDGDYFMLYIGNEVGRNGFGLARLMGEL